MSSKKPTFPEIFVKKVLPACAWSDGKLFIPAEVNFERKQNPNEYRIRSDVTSVLESCSRNKYIEDPKKFDCTFRRNMGNANFKASPPGSLFYWTHDEINENTVLDDGLEEKIRETMRLRGDKKKVPKTSQKSGAKRCNDNANQAAVAPEKIPKWEVFNLFMNLNEEDRRSFFRDIGLSAAVTPREVFDLYLSKPMEHANGEFHASAIQTPAFQTTAIPAPTTPTQAIPSSTIPTPPIRMPVQPFTDSDDLTQTTDYPPRTPAMIPRPHPSEQVTSFDLSGNADAPRRSGGNTTSAGPNVTDVDPNAVNSIKK